MLFAWSGYTLGSRTQERLIAAGKQTEKIVDNIRQVSRRAFRFYGLPCTPELLARLQGLVIETPHMRAIELSSSTVHCSPELRHVNEGELLFPSSAERITLLNETASAKSVSVLRIREDSPLNPLSVFADIDGYYISEILSAVQVYPPAFFSVREIVLTMDNQVRKMALLTGSAWHTIAFPHGGFEIHYVISNHIRRAYFWREYRWGLLCCISLTIIIFLFLNRTGTVMTAPLYALKNALNNNELVPYIQPVVSADTLAVIGGEILLRWAPPGEDIIPPDQFIPLAESSGLIIDITGEIFRMVKKSLVPIVRSGGLPWGFHLGVNISPQHLSRKALVKHCASFLAAFPKGSLTLVLEITERERHDVHKQAMSNFSKLKTYGIKFALDDFGTGYSTYSCLQHFPVDYLKIDKSLVQMIGEDDISGDIVEHIIMLSQRLKIKTIAEGVENDRQSRYLIEHGIQYLQGYAYGRPVPLTDFVKDLEKTT